MPIKDMITDIEQDVREEVEASKTRAKAEATKALMEKVDQLEHLYDEKKRKFEVYLQRREQTLRAEKDLSLRSKALASEDAFAQSLVPLIREKLAAFPEQNLEEYHQLLGIWLKKALQVLGDGNFVLRCNPRDRAAFSVSKNVNIKEDSSLEAGFILAEQGGALVDLSFASLFTDQQSSLQSKAMASLKGALK